MTPDQVLEAPRAPVGHSPAGDQHAIHAGAAPSGPHTVVVGAAIGWLTTAVLYAAIWLMVVKPT